MQDQVAADTVIDAGKKAINTATLMQHIVERRIELLLGTLIAYQLGLLDQLSTIGSSCLA